MIKVKKLHPRAIAPERTNDTDAGLDLCAFTEFGFIIDAGERIILPTAIAISIPDGYVGRILPRSGLAAKHGIHVLAGVIDSSYRGEIKVVLANFGQTEFRGAFGDRIAQLVIQKVELWNPIIVDELDDTERGEKGFGSSGA